MTARWRRGPGRPRHIGAAPIGLLAAVACTGLVVACLLVTVLADPRVSVDWHLPTWVSLPWAAGLLLMAVSAWLTAGPRPAVAAGLAVAAVGLTLPVIAASVALGPDTRAALAAFGPMAVAGIATIVAMWPRPGVVPVAVWAVGGLSVAAVAVHLAGYDPMADIRCARTCLHVDPVAGDLLSTRDAAVLSGSLVAAAAVVTLLRIVLVAGAMVPMRLRSAGAIALVLLGVAGSLRWALWSDPRSVGLQVLPMSIAVVCLGLGVAGPARAARRTSNAIGALVRALEDPTGSLTGDRGPILALEFAVPGEDRWLDASAGTAPAVDPRVPTLVLEDDGAPAIRLRLTASVDPSPGALSLGPAQRLAIRNARMRTLLRARFLDLQASRSRVVAAGDAERRQIERDLHDGAQQHLVAAAFHLGVLRGRLIDDREVLSVVDRQVQDALAGLRRIAGGIFPAELAREGLPAALERLAIESPVPMRVDIPSVPLDPSVAMAAYAMVNATLDQAAGDRAGRIDIDGQVVDGDLVLRVESQGGCGLDEARLLDVMDRIGAVGGQVRREPQPGGAVVEAVVPCAS